jgi:GH35 family endo-1,4-beta-xylanase
MTHHMTRLSQELEKNKDIVLWMDVVNETVVVPETIGGGKYKKGDWFGPLGKDASGKIIFWQNPWTKIGADPKTGIPLYILMAFDIANKHAPSIKKIYNQNGGGKDAIAWDKIKKTILHLRSIGQKVDGLGWQAHVQLGWEKDPANKKGIVELIDWCHANNLEFHITELNVNCQNETNWLHKREAQAVTIKAVMDTALENLHKGVVTVNFWDINSGSRNLSGNKNNYFGGVWHFVTDYNDPVYLAIKRSLLEHAPKK